MVYITLLLGRLAHPRLAVVLKEVDLSWRALAAPIYNKHHTYAPEHPYRTSLR